jgi:hypothetical protein
MEVFQSSTLEFKHKSICGSWFNLGKSIKKGEDSKTSKEAEKTQIHIVRDVVI